MISCCVAHLQEMEAVQVTHQQQLQQLAATHQQQLAAASSEASAALSRHLSLIDRLMEEKGQLANKLDDAQKAAVVRWNVSTCHCCSDTQTAMA